MRYPTGWWWDVLNARYEKTVHYLNTGWSWNYPGWVSQVQVLKK